MSELAVQTIVHDYRDLIRIFDHCFADSENTRLQKGEAEPIYLPADQDCDFHRIIFAHGFFASALHEVAHWCIAGCARRQQVDFGYWYQPDGRTAAQQRVFEQVEVKPQALEWIFSTACRKVFRVSADNLSGETSDGNAFKQAVYQQVLSYCACGLPPRAERFRAALAACYGTDHSLLPASYSRGDI